MDFDPFWPSKGTRAEKKLISFCISFRKSVAQGSWNCGQLFELSPRSVPILDRRARGGDEGYSYPLTGVLVRCNSRFQGV